MTNHLSNENSPYLLQHSNNPVDWYPWGDEALNRARLEDKPIFLSIGYAACHWCHVMERESFENPSTAALMNKYFINIKVDREERPDLDSIYMSATMAMTGSGGWPMSAFLTPDLQPFYTGTYFPPEPRFNMPSFRDLLTGISQAWINQREEIFRVGAQVTGHIQQNSDSSSNKNWPVTLSVLETATENILKSYDWGFGGWGDAPKFPQPMTIEFLLGQVVRDLPHNQESKSATHEKSLNAVTHVLQAMARGGMYDVVGGGFARYSVDNQWKTPHFEKMLYDNAQLAQAYLHAYLVTGEQKFRQVCEETLDFVLREMTHPNGGFFSSLDADSEGEEGKFYVWDFNELQSILGNDITFFEAAYGLSKTRQPSGDNQEIILQSAMDDKTLASRFNLKPDELANKLAGCHARLLEARSKRIRPGTDDKILTSWNAMALASFAEAGRYLSRPDYLDAAVLNAEFLMENLQEEGRLLRSWRNGSARHNAYLEDYAGLVLALLALYQSVPDQEWYTNALNLADEMVAHFTDPAGGFFDIRDDHETLLLRPKDIQDNATPSGNALAANALLKLAEYGDRPDWRKLAEEMLGSVMEAAIRYPTAFGKWLYAASIAATPARQIAIIGDRQKPGTQALLAVLWKNYYPNQVVAVSSTPRQVGTPSLLNNRPLLAGLPTACVCQNFVCKLPVNTPEEFSRQLDQS